MYYEIEDVNEYHFNCGHYPEWVVREREGPLPDPVPETRRGTPLAYAGEEAARAACDRLNRQSAKAWRAYLDA